MAVQVLKCDKVACLVNIRRRKAIDHG
jgi:hypothetical protein